MRMTVICCGYLRAVPAPCMALLRYVVTGVDVDEVKVKELPAVRAPFYEPGLPELLDEAMATGGLRFTTDVADAGRRDGEGPAVHFICVGTPQRKGEFAADTSYVDAALEALLPHVRA